MLELAALNAHYGKNRVVRSVDLKVGAGEVVALIGANAAGKSTTMRLIAGLKRATSGSIRLDGVEIERLSTPRRVGLGIALVPEGRQVFAPSTVLENLTMGAYHRPEYWNPAKRRRDPGRRKGVLEGSVRPVEYIDPVCIRG